MLRFNDGVSFDTSGPYRIERRHDGLYFVGGGMLCPIESYDEGHAMKRRLEDDAKTRAINNKNNINISKGRET